MFTILNDILSSPISAYIAFKGGTMALFLHGLDRFSTDLDFDIIDPEKKDEIIPAVETILRKYGKIREVRTNRKVYHIEFSYDDVAHNIKVEFSSFVRKANNYELVNFYGHTIKVMAPASVFANKLVALFERHLNRDLYDVEFFFRKARPISWEIIKERTGLKPNEFITQLILLIQKHFSKNTLLAGLGLVLKEQQKQDVKHNLIPKTLAQLEYLQSTLG